jgi:hypothetical protein
MTVRDEMRKPRGIETKNIYANIQKTKEYGCSPSFFVYIGGPSSSYPQQIHLKTQEDIRKLAIYLTKVVEWMDK